MENKRQNRLYFFVFLSKTGKKKNLPFDKTGHVQSEFAFHASFSWLIFKVDATQKNELKFNYHDRATSDS